MALAAISSVGGAFAFAPKANKTSKTYYASKTSMGFHWQTVKPTGESCQTITAPLSGICTIVTSNVPVDNVIPSGHTSNETLYQAN